MIGRRGVLVVLVLVGEKINDAVIVNTHFTLRGFVNKQMKRNISQVTSYCRYWQYETNAIRSILIDY